MLEELIIPTEIQAKLSQVNYYAKCLSENSYESTIETYEAYERMEQETRELICILKGYNLLAEKPLAIVTIELLATKKIPYIERMDDNVQIYTFKICEALNDPYRGSCL